MKAFKTFMKTNARLTMRCPDVIFFGMVMPVGILLLIGLITKGNAAYEGAAYSMVQGSFASLCTVGICATAFMGVPLTIADYRDKKILKHYFTTPVSPITLLAANMANDMVVSSVSAILVYIVARLVFGFHFRGSVLGFIGAFVLVMFAMYSLGFIMASLCPSVKAVNIACTVVYFPMLFLSGATIPYEIFPKFLQKIANVLPLTQGVKLLKNCALGLEVEIVFPLCVMIVSVILGVVITAKFFKWE